MGLDQPLYVQFTRYAGEILSGNLGESWKTGQPVLKELGDRLPATLELAATAFAMALTLGVLLGVLAAVYAGTWIDQGVRLYATLGAAQALFWLALLCVHVFYYSLGWAPAPLDRIIRRCLEKSPDARYANAGEILSDLRALHSAKPQPSRRRVFVVAAFALINGLGQMRERLSALLDAPKSLGSPQTLKIFRVTLKTFHALGAMLLREHAARLGLSPEQAGAHG
jgi:hypothetical protein